MIALQYVSFHLTFDPEYPLGLFFFFRIIQCYQFVQPIFRSCIYTSIPRECDDALSACVWVRVPEHIPESETKANLLHFRCHHHHRTHWDKVRVCVLPSFLSDWLLINSNWAHFYQNKNEHLAECKLNRR